MGYNRLWNNVRQYDSSLLTSVGWIDEMLEVEFRSNGEIWRYEADRPTGRLRRMMSPETPSAGSFFMRKIGPSHVGEKQ